MSPDTVKVYLGLGSNIDRQRHLKAGLEALSGAFGQLEVSPVYESEAVGFDGAPFLNLVVGLVTTWPLRQLAAFLKAVEVANGRTPESAGLNSKTLDIDILTFGSVTGVHDGVELPRGEILWHSFVLRPLADLAGDQPHPVTGQPYRSHWSSFTKGPDLRLIDFQWPDRTG